MPRERRKPTNDAATSVGSPDESALVMRGLSLVRSYKELPGIGNGIAWSADGSFLASPGRKGEAIIWAAETGQRQILDSRTNGISQILGVAWHPTRPILAIGDPDGQIRIWDANTDALEELYHVDAAVRGLAWSPDGFTLAVTDESNSISLCNIRKQAQPRIERLLDYLYAPCWSPDGQVLVVPDTKGVVNILRSDDLSLVQKLRGHTDVTYEVDITPNGKFAASASYDKTVRVWDLVTGQEIVTLEGHRHSAGVGAVRFSPHGQILVSMAEDEVRIWRLRDWECIATFLRHNVDGIGGLAFHPSLPMLAARDREGDVSSGRIDCFSIDYALLESAVLRPDSRRYVNAKVVLVGDTGVGKSGLGLVLSGQQYHPTDSTHGRKVWTLDSEEVEDPGAGRQTREILLWDLAGQPGYRLVHQLHLNEVTVALVVFDSRSETDPFSGVKHWVRALTQARRLEDTSVPLRSYLVAARADRGGVTVTRERIQTMIDDLGLDGFFETSAKEGWQVTELADAVRDGIAWDALPMVSSNALFESIKQFLLEEKEQGRVLCTADDLFRAFLRTRPDLANDHELRAGFETCIGRVESRDLIRRFQFGGLVLLQPELLDAYASAMVQAAKEEPDGLGFISEDEALAGRFRLAAEERIGDITQEKLLLIATVEELLRHEIALRETTDRGVDLVFPSQFTRERPDAPDIPGKHVIFTFDGPLHSIYASLAVRLAHSSLFRRQTMWQNAASFAATVGGTCGIHLHELEEGRGELTLFYDEKTDATVRSQFETYVAEYLQLRSLPKTVIRRAIRSCLLCGYALPHDLVQGKLALGMLTIRCPLCEESVISLRDEVPSGEAEAAVTAMNRSADSRRDRSVATTRLKGKIETGDYDVFLCHNSKDKPFVIAIGERLKERGILPWLDVWEIRPGMRWQKELQRNIKSVKSAAVFIGTRGPGPWQELEVESLLQQFARRNRPIIPVILEGRPRTPRLPAFLSSWHMVDMRKPDPDPFEQLVWGITGERSVRF